MRFRISGVKIAVAAQLVVILSGEFRLFRSKSYFGVRAKHQVTAKEARRHREFIDERLSRPLSQR
jgi:hypothetical protein